MQESLALPGAQWLVSQLGDAEENRLRLLSQGAKRTEGGRGIKPGGAAACPGPTPGLGDVMERGCCQHLLAMDLVALIAFRSRGTTMSAGETRLDHPSPCSFCLHIALMIPSHFPPHGPSSPILPLEVPPLSLWPSAPLSAGVVPFVSSMVLRVLSRLSSPLSSELFP